MFEYVSTGELISGPYAPFKLREHLLRLDAQFQWSIADGSQVKARMIQECLDGCEALEQDEFRRRAGILKNLRYLDANGEPIIVEAIEATEG